MIQDNLKNLLNFKIDMENNVFFGAGSEILMYTLLNDLLPVIRDLSQEIEKLKNEDICLSNMPSTTPEKKYKILLSDFEKNHEFCKKMHFSQGRLSKIIQIAPEHFKDTCIQEKGVKGRFLIEPQTFLECLLNYKFRNPMEKACVDEYKKQRNQRGECGKNRWLF
jgi:hypothetical protein